MSKLQSSTMAKERWHSHQLQTHVRLLEIQVQNMLRIWDFKRLNDGKWTDGNYDKRWSEKSSLGKTQFGFVFPCHTSRFCLNPWTRGINQTQLDTELRNKFKETERYLRFLNWRSCRENLPNQSERYDMLPPKYRYMQAQVP